MAIAVQEYFLVSAMPHLGYMNRFDKQHEALNDAVLHHNRYHAEHPTTVIKKSIMDDCTRQQDELFTLNKGETYRLAPISHDETAIPNPVLERVLLALADAIDEVAEEDQGVKLALIDDLNTIARRMGLPLYGEAVEEVTADPS